MLNSVAISTNTDDTSRDVSAFEYLMRYISSPTLLIMPLLRNRDPATMPVIIDAITQISNPAIFAINPSVFAPSVNAVRKDTTISMTLRYEISLQKFLDCLF